MRALRLLENRGRSDGPFSGAPVPVDSVFLDVGEGGSGATQNRVSPLRNIEVLKSNLETSHFVLNLRKGEINRDT